MFREKFDYKRILYWVYAGLMAAGIGIFIFCSITNQYTGMLYALWAVWISNVIWACMCFRERLLFLFFHVAYVTFFMARPLIEVHRNYKWWEFLGYRFTTADLKFALTLLLIGLCGLAIGGFLGLIGTKEKTEHFSIQFKYDKEKNKPYQREYVKCLRMVSLVLTLVSAAAYIYSNTYSFVWSINNGGYTASYTGGGPYIPYLVQVLGIMFKYTVIVYLITLPNKKNAYGMLGLYVLAEIPTLLMGNRGGFVLRVIFALVYFCIRDFSGDNEKWIGKFERKAIIIAAPAGIVFLSIYNYIRDGLSLMSHNVLMIISDFFYKQGVSFCTVCLAHNVMPLLKTERYISFTFGEVIDYWAHGIFAQRIFGAASLPSSNSVEMAIISNNLGHRISFLIDSHKYLNGHGYGSSYLLEGYADWGFIGALVLSIILGIVLVRLFYLLGRSRLLDVILLYMLANMFFIPRAEFTMLMGFLAQLQFWITMFLCFAGARVLIWVIKRGKITLL
jgi:oligosaccharide repeat unit polymerase